MNKKEIYRNVQHLDPLLKETSQYIWSHPEISDHEKLASQYYKKSTHSTWFYHQ